jgi:hypothetical protein
MKRRRGRGGETEKDLAAILEERIKFPFSFYFI